MRLYCSGPMTNLELFNFPAFDAAAIRLRKEGHEVRSPHEMDLNMGVVVMRGRGGEIISVDVPKDWSFYEAIKKDLEAIDWAEGIYLLPGWSKSLGAGIERDHAIVTGKEIIYDPEAELPENHKQLIRPPKIEFNRNQAYNVKWNPEGGDDEVRIVDPVTGGAKGSKLAQLGALDPYALMDVAKVAGFGSTKYERYNFAKGYRWSLSFDAMQRHLLAFWGGEDMDPESNLPHLAHGSWHGLALLTFASRKLGTDDRFPA